LLAGLRIGELPNEVRPEPAQTSHWHCAEPQQQQNNYAKAEHENGLSIHDLHPSTQLGEYRRKAARASRITGAVLSRQRAATNPLQERMLIMVQVAVLRGQSR
jgi:hypothetical protein